MIETISGFLMLMLAFTTGTIIVLQYLLAERHWRLSLYDKRYPVYLATKEYVEFIEDHASINDDELRKFLRDCRDKEFLFGEDIQEYLGELRDKGRDLKFQVYRLSDADRSGEERQAIVKKQEDLLRWFLKQSDTLRERFGRYLRIDKK